MERIISYSQQTSLQQQSSRAMREKEWHNETFESGNRNAMKKYYSAFGATWADFVKKIRDNLNPDSTVFLDYGCGAGQNFIEVYDKISKGIGIDISEKLIEHAKLQAKEQNIKNFEYFVMDAMNTTFEDKTFDILRGSCILHHLNLEQSLNEIKRILKDDGKAFFHEPLGTNPIIALYRKFTPKARTYDERPFSRKDIKLIEKIFPNAQISYGGFCTLFAVPLRNLKIFGKILHFLHSIDKIILHRKSPLKYLAWYCYLTLKK
jgi:SAM-dependent methyltransferase